MKDVYNPDNDDILEWIRSGGGRWPASDWDFYVMCGKNDSLVLRLAHDLECKEREFFLHCLYYLVGDYFNGSTRDAAKMKRIQDLLESVDDTARAEVNVWASETSLLLQGKLEFQSDYWMNHFIWDELQS